jgi:hypothetical protein
MWQRLERARERRIMKSTAKEGTTGGEPGYGVVISIIGVLIG